MEWLVYLLETAIFSLIFTNLVRNKDNDKKKNMAIIHLYTPGRRLLSLVSLECLPAMDIHS